MNFWKKPIIAQAPMAGVTDEAFRLMLLKYGKPDVFFTEFVSVEGLFSRGRKVCLKILEHSPKEKPIVAQLFGADPVDFEKAARLVAELGFDGIDINMGCPDANVEKKGGGAALIKNPGLAKKIIRATKNGAGKLPVSVKTRIGYAKNEITNWIRAILEENISALIVHFRTRNQTYGVPANWQLAKEIVKLRDEISPKTLIIGNGDVKSLLEAKKLTRENKLDGIMIGRALLGNPWFFTGKIPGIKETLRAVAEHAETFDKCHKEEVGEKKYHKKFASIKKNFHAYVKGFYGAKELRDELMKVKNTAETKAVVKKFCDIIY